MLELVELIAKELVTKPEEVEVSSRQEGNTFVIEIRANKDDLGRIIGKEGRIAKAIRTIVKASAIKDGVKVAVDILQ